ncbi:MAG: hypothetical protein AB7D36_08960 [Oscillospiraceae bacterium]
MTDTAAGKKRLGKQETAIPKKAAATPSKKLPAKRVPQKKQTASPGERAFPWIPAAVCLLLSVCLIAQGIGGKYDLQLCFALGAGAVVIATFIKKDNRALLFEKITPIFTLLFAQCLLFFAGLFYGSYPKFALQQFFLNIGGLFIFASMAVYFLRGGKTIKIFFSLFAACVAFISLISIELATSRSLLGIFEAAARMLGTQLPANYAIFEENTRITTVLGNPNVFAPVAVLGMFAALCACGKAGSHRRIDAFLMGLAVICGTAFILCFSLGTILVYIPALLGILLLSKKENRGAVFFSNAFCLLTSFLLAFMVFVLRDKGLLPVLSVLLFSAGAAFAYTHLEPIKLPKIKTGGKMAKIIVVLAICALFLVSALSLYGPYSLSAGGMFRRAAALEPGAYSISVTLDDPESGVSVEIDSMSYAQAALKEITTLKTSAVRSGETLEFEVPESSAAVFFRFSASADIQIESAEITGADTAKPLPLRYRLLPEFIVNRLQGLWVNDNAIQRLIFFRDGIRLGMTSPVIGLGGGAFGGGLYGVADYQYETKHTHNEYIQDFIDGGIIGLFLFIALTVFIFRALYKAKKSDKNPTLLPFLFGSMLLIFLHAMLDVDFSMPAYKLTASALFALTAASCGDVFTGGKILKKTLRYALPAICAVGLVLAVGRIHAVNLVTSDRATLDAFRQAALCDPFDSADYKLSYLINSASISSDTAAAQRKAYLASLENQKLYGDSEYWLAYYYLTEPEPDVEKGIAASENYIREKRVDPDTWDSIFKLYNAVLDKANGNTAVVQKTSDSVRSLCAYLTELNTALPKVIEPELAAYTYMRTTAEAQEKQVTADSRILCDFDRDGVSDIVGGNAGDTVEWTLDVVMEPTVLYTVKVYQDSASSCEVLLGGQPKTCEYNDSEGCFEVSVFCVDTESEPLIVRSGQQSAYFTIEKTSSESAE